MKDNLCKLCHLRPAQASSAICVECHRLKYNYRLGKKCPGCGKPILDWATSCTQCRFEKIRIDATRRCEYCGKEIVAIKHPRQRFCGRSCASRANQVKGPRDVEAHFWAKVDKRGPDDCWEWQAGTNKGYGAFHFQGRNKPAHCVAYILTYGSIPEAMFLRHKCDNRLCVNPAHLIPGTHWDNMRDVAEHRKLRQAGAN